MSNVKGLTELKMNLAKAILVTEAAAHEAIALEAEAIKADAVNNAPVGATGNLKSGIEARPEHLRAEVVSTVWYSHFVENGTTKMAAKPFMAPAAEGARVRFQTRARTMIKTALERL